LYDVADRQKRGGHAHKRLQQLIIPAVGSFNLVLDDGYEKREVVMDRPDRGLHIPGHIWTEVMNFSPGSVCMVLASLPYDEEEYIRDYRQFLRFKNMVELLSLETSRRLPTGHLTSGENLRRAVYE
jgi:hypothetical protein